MQYLTSADLGRACCTGNEWLSLAGGDRVWKPITLRYYGKRVACRDVVLRSMCWRRRYSALQLNTRHSRGRMLGAPVGTPLGRRGHKGFRRAKPLRTGLPGSPMNCVQAAAASAMAAATAACMQ